MFKSILRRLRPRFSVRMLLALVLVSGIGLGILAATVRKARRQRHAVVATKKLGWWVYYEGEYYQAGFRPRNGPARHGWLRKWLGDDFFDTVTHVTLFSSSDHIDADMAHIEAFPELEQLCVDRLPVTDAGIAHLSGLSKLQRLSLREVPITDAALDPVSRLPSLTVVCLDRTRVGDGALLSLGRMPQLRLLSLEWTHVTDAGLAHLVGLQRLESLHVNCTAITDVGLPHLYHLPSLKDLWLIDTFVTPEGVASIKAALPDCQVHWYPKGTVAGPFTPRPEIPEPNP
jgi:hypothetical protein